MAVTDLVKLKSPEEMGTKLQFNKYRGAVFGFVLKQQKDPDMKTPTVLTEDEEKNRDLVDDYKSDRKDHRA